MASNTPNPENNMESDWTMHPLLDVMCKRHIEDTLQNIIQHYQLPACCIAFEVPGGLRLTGRYGIETKFVTQPKRGKSICSHHAQRKLPTIIYDAAIDPRYMKDDFVVGPPYTRFFIGVPFLLAKTHVGSLCLMDPQPREFFSLNDCQFLEEATQKITTILGTMDNLLTVSYVLTLEALPVCLPEAQTGKDDEDDASSLASTSSLELSIEQDICEEVDTMKSAAFHAFDGQQTTAS